MSIMVCMHVNTFPFNKFELIIKNLLSKILPKLIFVVTSFY